MLGAIAGYALNLFVFGSLSHKTKLIEGLQKPIFFSQKFSLVSERHHISSTTSNLKFPDAS